MTVLAVKILASPEEGVPPMEEREMGLLALYGQELPGQATPVERIAANEADGTPEHVRSVRRVSMEHDKETMLDAIEALLEDREWYTIETHICRNGDGLPCGPWLAERGLGAAPEGI